MNFPPLYKKASTGKIQMWQISVKGAGHTDHNSDGWEVGVITTMYGQLVGAKQTKVEEIVTGKNRGKANETTPYEQACAEAKSRWEKKSQKHYVQSIEEAEAGSVDETYVAGGIAPMLAHTFTKQGHKIKWPAYVQPKLDGHRCIAMYDAATRTCTLWSRQQKLITGVPHINRAIEKMFEFADDGVMIFDGELYRHDEQFESLSSFIRQVEPKPGHVVVQYWIFDVVRDDPFSVRKEYLDVIDAVIKKHELENTLISVATFEADSDEAMRELFSIFMEQNYEGAMVRNAKGRYLNKRSYDLQKVKEFDDAEFPIVDVVEGRGGMKGCAIFVCEAPNGKTFNCKMMGDLDNLITIWENKNDYIGQKLTVKYQGMSQYGIPRFPVGVRVYEEV